jgi:hypothetical protein
MYPDCRLLAQWRARGSSFQQGTMDRQSPRAQLDMSPPHTARRCPVGCVEKIMVKKSKIMVKIKNHGKNQKSW